MDLFTRWWDRAIQGTAKTYNKSKDGGSSFRKHFVPSLGLPAAGAPILAADESDFSPTKFFPATGISLCAIRPSLSS